MHEIARWIVNLMPDEHRARYGEEMLELLHDSPRPAGDLINVAACVLRWHMEVAVSRPLAMIAAVLGAISLFTAGYVVADLADGLTELHRHWWSTLPFIGLLLAAGLAIAARSRGSADRLED